MRSTYNLSHVIHNQYNIDQNNTVPMMDRINPSKIVMKIMAT